MNFEAVGFEKLSGPKLIKIKRFEDERGFFSESFRASAFLEIGLPEFVQENHSFSKPGTFRGLHYQLNPEAQGKLVHCAYGQIVDYIVDIRVGSSTYGKHIKVNLGHNVDYSTIYVPPGFAHGFYVPGVHVASVIYKVTKYYSPQHERAINYADPTLDIGLGNTHLRISDKDKIAPMLVDAENNFIYRE